MGEGEGEEWGVGQEGRWGKSKSRLERKGLGPEAYAGIVRPCSWLDSNRRPVYVTHKYVKKFTYALVLGVYVVGCPPPP